MEIPGELLREITNTILKSVHDKDKLYEKIDNEMIKKSDVAFTKNTLSGFIDHVEHNHADPRIKLDALLFALKKYAD